MTKLGPKASKFVEDFIEMASEYRVSLSEILEVLSDCVDGYEVDQPRKQQRPTLIDWYLEQVQCNRVVIKTPTTIVEQKSIFENRDLFRFYNRKLYKLGRGIYNKREEQGELKSVIEQGVTNWTSEYLSAIGVLTELYAGGEFSDQMGHPLFYNDAVQQEFMRMHQRGLAL